MMEMERSEVVDFSLFNGIPACGKGFVTVVQSYTVVQRRTACVRLLAVYSSELSMGVNLRACICCVCACV
jgi:hypothetical protein